jgi:phenylacetate-CoA ligase
MVSPPRLPGLRLALLDMGRKTRIAKFRPELEESQWLSHDELEALQLVKLKDLVTYAVEHVPFYRALKLEKGLDTARLVSLSDLESWPVVGKPLMRKDPAAFRPDGMSPEATFTRRTGGSTGDPFEYLVGTTAFSLQWAALFRAWEWSGYRLGDPMVTLGGGSVAPAGGLSLSQKIYNGLRGNRPLPAASLDRATLEGHEKQMRAYRPRLVYGYPSVLYQMALHLEGGGGSIPSVAAVVTTSEMLFPGQRAVLERAFGAPVFDLYGCNETNLITGECEHHAGLHVAMEASLVEILDDNDQPVPPGKSGRVVATGLANRGMIFLRYDTGDVGSLDPDPCQCSRGLVRIRSLEGRTRDLVRAPDGKLIHGVSFNEMVLEHPWVDRYQAIQVDEENLIFNVTVTGEVGSESLGALKSALEAMTGLNVEMAVNRPLETTPGGKTRVIISRLEGDHGG